MPPVTDAPWTGDACSLVDAFRRGERNPTEELDATYAAIDASRLNAFCHLDREWAYRVAAAADVALPFGGDVRAAGGPDAAASRVDLNSASVEELARLPGIGPAKAQAIVSHRSTSPFRKPEDLREVKGIGDKLYEQLKDQITVGGPAAGSSDRGG